MVKAQPYEGKPLSALLVALTVVALGVAAYGDGTGPTWAPIPLERIR